MVVIKDCFEKSGVFNATPAYFGVDDCDMWSRNFITIVLIVCAKFDSDEAA
jgi:hypothetical protein